VKGSSKLRDHGLAFGRQALRDVRVNREEAPAVEHDLSDNTNQFGAPPALTHALERYDVQALSRYPTTYSAPLRKLLAGQLGVDVDEIVVACGSDELIDCAFRALAEPRGCVAYMSPTFVMVRPFALTNALEPIAVPLRPDLSLDVEALLAAHPDLIYLCSPNNPTGTLLSAESIDAIVQRFSGPIVLDEAYAEYSGITLADRSPGFGNVLVLRTLSKAWGMAGLRIGYALGARSLVEAVEKVRGPFKLSALSEQCAVSVLSEPRSHEWMRSRVDETIAVRERFTAALSGAGIVIPPSAANFVLIPVRHPQRVAETLLEQRIAVRTFDQLPVVGNAIRVTIGPWDVMRRVLDVLVHSMRAT
jgi:histidinol-phosphate aminotransferase